MASSIDRPRGGETGRTPGGTGPAAASGPDRLARGLLLVALVAGGVRLVGLATWSLWYDEVLTLADSTEGVLSQNPLGYWLFRTFFDAFEGRPSELQLRLPAALLGWACIPLVVWAFRPYTGARAAAVAALVVALSPWHVYWSQTARFYTLSQGLALLGGGWLLRGLFGSGGRSVLLGAAGLFLGVATHPSAAFLAAALFAAPWLVLALPRSAAPGLDRRALRVLAALGLVALVGGSVWAREVWLTWDERQGRGDPVHFVKSFGYLLTPALGLAFLVGSACAWRARARPAVLLSLVVVLGVLAALVVSRYVRVSAQYVFVFLPWVAAVAALPLARAGEPRARGRAWKLAYAALVLLPLAAETTIYLALRHGDRPRWKEAYAYVFDHRQETDLVFGMDAPVAEYYWNPTKENLRDWREVVLLDTYRFEVPDDWARFGRRAWFVVNLEQLLDWAPHKRDNMRRLLAEECEERAVFEVPWTPRDLDVRVYSYEP